MTFETLGLSHQLLKAISDSGYTNPTDVQLQAIPPLLEGKDIAIAAQTGTGKTASFTLPLLQTLSKPSSHKHRYVRALILTPTRELATQVRESVCTYSKFLPLKSTVVVGGASMFLQIKKLRQGVDVLVATPGRLLDLVSQRAVDLSKVEVLVMDEADRMLDMGFIHDMRQIVELLPKQCQNIMCSATFSKAVKKLAEGFLKTPQWIEVTPPNTTTELVAHSVYPVDSKKKRELLTHLISSQNRKSVLVFTRTKHVANTLTTQLIQDGISSVAIHGNKTHSARAKALSDFKKGAVRVLVATDVAARGLDIDKLPFVVNYELPFVAEDYIHRVGRTGRAGQEGEAASLVCVDEHRLLKDIEKLLNYDLQKIVLPGYEPDPKIRPVPIPNGFGRQKKRGGFDPRGAGRRSDRGFRSRSNQENSFKTSGRLNTKAQRH